MADDIRYLYEQADGVVEAPLVILGTCTGDITLAQQVLNTLFPSTSNLREFGGGLYDALTGANLNETTVAQLINNYLVDTRNYLELQLDTTVDITVESVRVEDRNLVARLILVPGDTGLETSVEVSINTEG